MNRKAAIYIFAVFVVVLPPSAQDKPDKAEVKISAEAKETAQASISNLDELRMELIDAFNDPNFANAFWGVDIQSLKTGETFYKVNADKLFSPASLLKLFTTSSALLLLGSDYQYKTTIYTDGNIKNHTLHGNLVIKGSGDPSISNRFIDGSVNVVFEMWADSLKKLGIKKIDGNIIGDDDNFDEVRLGKGWSHEVINNWFAPPSGALCFNDNSISITIVPTEPGMPADITIEPNSEYKFLKKVVTISSKNEPNIEISKKNGSQVISVSGLISKDSPAKKFYVSVDDPTEYFLYSLYNTLTDNGIEITGAFFDKDDEGITVQDDNLTPLFSHFSVPLSKLITEVNKNSNNFYAEQIFRTIGYELIGYGDINNSLMMTEDILKKMGINPDNLMIVDGSGLSKLDLVTPKQVINVLSYLYKSDEFGTFYGSLPVAGTDGTLADRYKNTTGAKNIHAKTGYLENIRSLAGYLKTADGEPIVFCIIVNNFLVPSQLANYLQDKVCSRLVNFSRN